MAVHDVSSSRHASRVWCAAILLGLAVGAPALRTRGINLAIATLGLGVVLYAADPQQLRDHRRGERPQGGARAPPRLGYRPGQAPAAVRNRRPVPAAGDVPGRRQPAPWCGGSTSARSALRRAPGGGAGRQRLFRQVVLVHARIWYRRSRRLHACVPQQQCCLLPIRHLHVDQRRDGDCRRWRWLHPWCSPRLFADARRYHLPIPRQDQRPRVVARVDRRRVGDRHSARGRGRDVRDEPQDAIGAEAEAGASSGRPGDDVASARNATGRAPTRSSR